MSCNIFSMRVIFSLLLANWEYTNWEYTTALKYISYAYAKCLNVLADNGFVITEYHHADRCPSDE